jgi:hypothetical protein
VSVTSEQIRAARALLRWEQRDLAAASKIPLPAIESMEAVRGPLAAQAGSIEAIIAAISAAGVDFIEENGGGAGVRLRKPQSPAISDEAALPEMPERAADDYDGSPM